MLSREPGVGTAGMDGTWERGEETGPAPGQLRTGPIPGDCGPPPAADPAQGAGARAQSRSRSACPPTLDASLPLSGPSVRIDKTKRVGRRGRSVG